MWEKLIYIAEIALIFLETSQDVRNLLSKWTAD